MKVAWSRKNAWERLPRAVRRAAGRALGCVPLPYLLGRRFRKVLRFVADAQWWPTDRLRSYQLRELRRVCWLAYQDTRFYREYFDDAGFCPADLRSLESFADVPTIDKKTIQENLDCMCTVSPRAPHVDFVSTGGTSGNPLHFYMGAGRSAVEFAYLVASWRRAGYEPGTTLAVFRGRVVPEARDGLRHEYDPILRSHYYSTFHMTDEDMQQYLNHVGRIAPCFLHVYPSSIAALANFIRRSGSEPPHNIRGIIAESEITYPEQRQIVEEIFGCRYFSCYGHTEKLVLGAECEHSTDYHVWPTYGYFELLDEQDKPVTMPGQRGEIVGTGFINHVVPFIRYRTGDWATYVGDRCQVCGRQHPVIRYVRGHRIQEFLIARDGSAIPWTAVNMHDDTFCNVRQLQFYQDTPGQVVLRLVRTREFGNLDHRRITARLKLRLQGQLTLTIEYVPGIPVTARGKGIYVDQRVAVPPRAALQQFDWR